MKEHKIILKKFCLVLIPIKIFYILKLKENQFIKSKLVM